MAFDFKKEYKEFYMPASEPSIVTVPSMNYIAVRGEGDPNAEDGAYKQAIGLLYGIAFTIKMSKMGDHRIEGYFDYVVPPLEGFWWQDGVQGITYCLKQQFCSWVFLLPFPDDHTHMISVTLIQLLPDCLDQANQIADISCFIRETHIDNGALIRKTIEFSVYFHAAFSEFLPEIPGKNNICSSVFRRFMNDTVKFICIMVI